MIPSTTNLNAKSLVVRMKQAAEQGDGDALVALAHELSVNATQPGMADTAHRLMGLTQKAAVHRTQQVAQILVRAGTPASRPYMVMATALEETAVLEPGVARFMANRQEAKKVLFAALAAVPDAEAMSQKLRIRLARIQWQMGDEEGLSELVAEVENRAKQGGHDHAELAKLAFMCMDSRHGLTLRESVRIAVEREPESVEVLRAHVRGLVADRQPIDAWWPRIKQAAVDHPNDVGLMRFATFCAHDLGEWTFVEEAHQGMAPELADPFAWEKAGLALLRMGQDERAIEWLGRARPRVPPQRVGPLAAVLKSLLHALNCDHYWGDVPDYQGLKQELAGSLMELQRTLSSTDYAPKDLLQAATAIGTVEKYPFYVLAQIIDQKMYVEHWDARYGTFDLRTYSVVWRALIEHQALLLGHAVERMLGGAPPGTLNALRETAERFVQAKLTLDEPEAAIQTLQMLESEGCCGLFFQELADQCLLHRSNLADVQTRVQARPSTGLRNAKVCGVEQAREWVLREGLETRVLWEEGPAEASFEKAMSDGQIEVQGHKVEAFTLRAMEARSLILAGSDVIIGPHGTALRPSHWHYRGTFPERTGLARSAAAGGAVLDLAGPVRRIDEPVIVLACNDTAHVPNYYHWVNFILTRCVFLLEQGLLEGRRLLMPAEVKPWMRGALELVGLSEDRLLSHTANEVLHISEATVVNGFDYPGVEYMRSFRSFMWKAANARSDSGSSEAPLHIFMVRPTDNRRPFFGRERILQIAQNEGFRCIDPAQLSVADQVRLFANAASVAGFGGAAFTNMAFCRPGMPALELIRREATWPDFTGIALALGIKYRFCPGWIPSGATGTPRVHDGPTRFDEAMVQRELNRLKTASA